MIFLGPNKAETMFMISFDIKYGGIFGSYPGSTQHMLGKVSPIFFGQNIAKNDISGSK